jgi:hypothetical protein
MFDTILGMTALSVQRFIKHSEGDFESLALLLFANQYEKNLPYRRLCDALRQTPTTVMSWREIPPVPAAAFKRLALTCAPEADCVKIFHSSGTTGPETSRHFMDYDALETYNASLREGWSRLLPDLPVVALMPSPEDAPHSSLSFMAAELGAEFVWGEKLTLPRLTQPVILFGTAFAFVNLFDSGRIFSPLPEGSFVVETGGFKGKSREVSREELYGWFTRVLGVPEKNCFSEYGMSELTSQFYSVGLSGPKLGPPWIRTRALDPITNTDAAPGEPGLLAHWDLANTNSCLAVQTEDFGVMLPDNSGFTLLGRAPGAVLRGCSLTAEDFFAL